VGSSRLQNSAIALAKREGAFATSWWEAVIQAATKLLTFGEGGGGIFCKWYPDNGIGQLMERSHRCNRLGGMGRSWISSPRRLSFEIRRLPNALFHPESCIVGFLAGLGTVQMPIVLDRQVFFQQNHFGRSLLNY